MAETIMVVDDNENATRMTARMLSGLGFEVMTALDAATPTLGALATWTW